MVIAWTYHLNNQKKKNTREVKNRDTTREPSGSLSKKAHPSFSLKFCPLKPNLSLLFQSSKCPPLADPFSIFSWALIAKSGV